MSRSIAFGLALMAAAVSAAFAGNIPGRLQDSRNVNRAHIYSSVNIAGSNNSSGYGTGTTSTDWEGIFYWANLAAGTYSQGFSEKDQFNIFYRKGISVPASGDALWRVLNYKPTMYSFHTEWFTTWHTWYAQTFRATGQNLISVAARVAGPASGNVVVTIHNGDNANAPQIGPARLLAASTTNPQCAYWSAGEVSTTPGQVYTIKLALEGGGPFSLWRSTVREWMRHLDCRTWADGVLVGDPLELTVNQDDSFFVNTMCCARQIGYSPVSSYGGQTFTSRGSSVLAVTWLCGQHAQPWAISIHDGAGSGSGGTQIGPTKYVYGVGWDGRSIVTWAPGEVPTTPGHTYYVKLVQPSSTIYRTNNDYSGGTAYINGVAQNYDFAVGVYEEKFSGAVDQSDIAIGGMTVTDITPTSAVVRWNSTGQNSAGITVQVPADATVRYGTGAVYTQSVYDGTLTNVHAVALTNLTPHTMYHVRVHSAASGYRSGRSEDFVFVTAPGSPNLLGNPGFETGSFAGWVALGGAKIAAPAWYYGSGARTGSWGMGNAVNGGSFSSGAYQRRPAVPGQDYTLSAWMYTYTTELNATTSYQTIGRLGIDPTGGIDPNSPNIVWTPLSHCHQAWANAAVSATAQSPIITVFLYGGNQTSTTWSVMTFDDAILTGPIPQSTPLHTALGDTPDGEVVTLSGVICTATSAQATDYYVEASDRACGIRVKTQDVMQVGESVVVSGTLATRASGERQLAQAMAVSQTPTTAVKPLYAVAADIGGGSPGPHCAGVAGMSGAYNVGMLMRISGTVMARETGFIWVNDGSLPGNGLKVNMSATSVSVGTGFTVGVTGIVRLENDGVTTEPVLKPRMNSDLRPY